MNPLAGGGPNFLGPVGEWVNEANCRDANPEVFFEDPGTAKVFCQSCPVAAPCFGYAMRNPVIGVWGNTTLAERQQLRRRHKVQA